MPTVLNLAEIEFPLKNKSIISGIDIVKNKDNLDKNRIIRTDTRLLLQEGRITSLRSNSLKLVIYHDENKELYNLENDPQELSPLKIINSSKTKNFDDYLNNSNQKINQYHQKYISTRIITLEKFFNKSNNNQIKVLIFGKFNFLFIEK